MKLLSTLSILSLSFSITSCVPEAEHNKVVSERNELALKNDSLKKELEDIKFGAPNLLSDGKAFFDAKEFTKAKEKLEALVERHPDMPQTLEAKKYLPIIDEEIIWNNASNSTKVETIENYLENYPKGKYTAKAKTRKSELKALNLKQDYDNATTQNTSSAWKKFLENYPNHPQASAIKKKIIQLEVDEILGNSKTGEMPASQQYGSGHSSNSTVEIKNDTGCELTVRYSGPDVKMVTISAGSSQTVYLSSGSYKVAASACGSNYGGTEDLHGKYGSSFYITHSRY
jgi:outer membrane protein assembly factor BamD (BamD/ComL family)